MKRLFRYFTAAEYALVYATNDIIPVILWVPASLSDPRYISLAVCFAVFFINDLYGFARRKRMEHDQGGY